MSDNLETDTILKENETAGLEENKSVKSDSEFLDSKIDIIRDDLKSLKQSMNEFINSDKASFSENINKLGKAVVLITDVPSDVSKSIEQIAPKVAANLLSTIEKNIGDSFNKIISECNFKVDELYETIKSIDNEVDRLQETRWKRMVANIITIMLISFAATIGATYYTLTKFPQIVRIEHNGDMKVENSRVFVDSLKNNRR